MKKKIILVLITLLSGAAIASAQISTGEPSSSVYKSGNRPEAGDFGLFVGAGVIFDYDFANARMNGGPVPDIRPLINLKYFATDEIEARLGIHVGRTHDNTKSTLNADDAKSTKNNESRGSFNLYPGVAYHFNKLNLLDVYVGAELPFGFVGTASYKGNSDAYNKSSSWNPYIGLGAFVGLQAFIGNLPLGIALEYGISGKIVSTKLPKVVAYNGTDTQSYYYEEAANKQYKAYSGSAGVLGSEIRLTLSYYFK